MLRIVLVLTFISFSQQCCTPGVWEGDERTLLSILYQGQTNPTVIKGNYKVYYDAGRRMVVLSGTTNTDGKDHTTQTIQDYNRRIQYDIYDGICTTKQLPVFPGNCLPDNATRFDTYLATGSLTMPIQVYSFPLDGLQITMSVDANCVPIGQTFYGTQDKQRMFGSTSFENMVGRASLAASLFSVPVSCNNAIANGLIGRRGLAY